MVVEYVYDAWGNPIIISGSKKNIVGALNPLRYRGYIYDTETGLFYVSSRYYNPEVGRFINADTPEVLGVSPMGLTDKNLYAYCDNNPVMREDDGGRLWNTVIGAVTGGIIGGISAAIECKDIGAGILSGAISGGVSGAAVDIAITATIATGGAGLLTLGAVSLFGGFGAAGTSYINKKMNGEEIIVSDIIIDGICGAIGTAISYGTAGVGTKAAKTTKQIFSMSKKKIADLAIEDTGTALVTSTATWVGSTIAKRRLKQYHVNQMVAQRTR